MAGKKVCSEKKKGGAARLLYEVRRAPTDWQQGQTRDQMGVRSGDRSTNTGANALWTRLPPYDRKMLNTPPFLKLSWLSFHE
ncbi:MAG TPA: hypothetical protein DD856_03850 [Sulfobacillus sp.]|nr:hypothetical protein [Sulfobacillus sp.]